jgi:hypothetical protein
MKNGSASHSLRAIQLRGQLASLMRTTRPVLVSCLASVLLTLLLAPTAIAQSVAAPLFQYAIFYNGVLEFSTCSPMTINGPVRCNTNIYVGAAAGGTLTFNSTVTAGGIVMAPTNNGANWGNPTNFSSSWRTAFNGNPPYVTNAPVVNLLYWAGNSHEIIDPPPAGEAPTSALGQQRLFNLAHVLLLVSNLNTTTNITVTTIVQQSVNQNVPGADPAAYVSVYTNPSPSFLASTLPFLMITNRFYDGREKKTNLTTQIDIGKYTTWLATNAPIADKFPAGSGTFATILYVADNRITTAGQLTVVRLTNGIALPRNGGQGFSLATANPLYIWGNYNCTNPAYLGTTNTGASVPAALFSDAVTILSSNWKDTNSFTPFSTSATAWNASSTNTVNAALLSGIVPSTGPDNMHFSGGVHNFTRLLEDWNGCTLWLNTSIVNLYNSTRATNQFLNPNTYYYPPTRRFSFDLRFSDPNGATPPGTPMILYTNLLTVLTQPQSHSVTAGQPTAFSVIADGVPTLHYQWRLDQIDIPGATNSTLVISNAGPADAGTYSVFITNTFGSLTSSNAALTVHYPPTITSEPAGQATVLGSNVVFEVTATGDGPLSYQWYFNGTNAIAGATNAVLLLDAVSPELEGQYSVLVWNDFGGATSDSAELAVYESAASLLSGFSYTRGVGVQFTVTGVPGFRYAVQASTNLFQWESLGTNTAPFNVLDPDAAALPRRFYRAVFIP